MRQVTLHSFLFWLIALLVALPLSVAAQQSFRIADYFPSQVGDEWQFKNLAPDGLSPILIKVSAQRDFKGQTVFQRDENNGDYRYQSHTPGKGLMVHHLYFKGDRVIEYETPVVLIPESVRLGDTHKSETKYTYRVSGEAKERGTQTYVVKVVGLGEAETPSGKFSNCLLIRTTALRTDESGAQKGYELNEWHVKGVGAVKVVGDLYWNDAKGQRTRTFKVNALLEKAMINGKPLPGDPIIAQGKKPMNSIDPKKVAHTLEVGTRGFEHFKHGLATGQWQPFIEMLTDDFTFFFPSGKYQGLHVGKDKAVEFFTYVSQAFGEGGMKVTEVLHVTAGESTIVFEFRDEGKIFNNPYKNRVAVSWTIRGDKIAGYREYFGSDGKSN